MSTKRKMKPSTSGAAKPTTFTLADVVISLRQESSLSATRLRDLQSAVKRVADLLSEEPGAIPLDLPAISTKLASVNPIAVGVSAKTLANLRSGFLSAVKVSGLKPVQHSAKTPLSAAWVGLMARFSGKRAHLGLSSFARYASANEIEPQQVNDAAIEGFISAVREGSLHRKPNDLHRQVTLIWNEVAKLSGLRLVTVASFRAPIKRVDWTQLTASFRQDLESHLHWCGGTDVFAANARYRALAPRTLKLRRNQIHAAVTALVESGVKDAVAHRWTSCRSGLRQCEKRTSGFLNREVRGSSPPGPTTPKLKLCICSAFCKVRVVCPLGAGGVFVDRSPAKRPCISQNFSDRRADRGAVTQPWPWIRFCCGVAEGQRREAKPNLLVASGRERRTRYSGTAHSFTVFMERSMITAA